MTKMTNEEAMKELSYIADEMPSMECEKWIEAISMGIKALKQTRWIPVSERLPEKEGRYLVTCKIGFSLNEDIENDETVDMAFYKDGHWSKYILYEDIYAWMPLPLPCRPEVEDSYITIPVSLIKNMCKVLSEFEQSNEDCFDKIHDACVDIDAYCRDKLNKEGNQQIREDVVNNDSISRQIEEEVLQIISDQINNDNKVECDSTIDMSNKTSTPQQKPCDDAISRQAALNMQYRIDDSATLSSRNVVNVDDIENLQPVNPVKKMGKWIVNPFGTHGNLICDNCFASAPYNYRTKYCPNCGLPKDTGGT